MLLSTIRDGEVSHSKRGEESHIVSATKKSKNPTTTAICESLAPTGIEAAHPERRNAKICSENTTYMYIS